MSKKIQEKNVTGSRKTKIEMHKDIFKEAFSFNSPDKDTLIQPLAVFNECMDCFCNTIQPSSTEYENLKFISELFYTLENRKCIYAEFIFHAYLHSLISSDISNEQLLNNEEILYYLTLPEIGGNSTFSNTKTRFKESYNIYENGIIHEHSTYNVFQLGFYNLITYYNIFSNTETDAKYAVPKHFAPVFISIISAWNYSPIIHASQKLDSHRISLKPSFKKFRKKVMNFLTRFQIDDTFQLFAEYFICFFFDNTYISAFTAETPSHFYEFPPKEAAIYHNEAHNYDNILCDINNNVPFLVLKKFLVQKATDIYKYNSALLTENNFIEVNDSNISVSIDNFIKLLREESADMKSDIKQFMDEHLHTKKISDKNCIIKPDTESYIDLLQKKFTSHTDRIQMLLNYLKEYLCYYTYYDHNTIKTIFDGTLPFIDSITPMHNTDNPDPDCVQMKYRYHSGKTSHRLTKFYEHIFKFSENIFESHKNQLEKEMPLNEEFDVKTSLINASYNKLLKIDGFIDTLNNKLKTNQPVQVITNKPKKFYYSYNFNHTAETAVAYYQNLFFTFYEKLTSKTTGAIPLWQILHICISDNAEDFQNCLHLPK